MILATLFLVAVAPRAPAQYYQPAPVYQPRGFGVNVSIGRQFAPPWSAPAYQLQYAPPFVIPAVSSYGCNGGNGGVQSFSPYAFQPPFTLNQYNGAPAPSSYGAL